MSTLLTESTRLADIQQVINRLLSSKNPKIKIRPEDIERPVSWSLIEDFIAHSGVLGNSDNLRVAAYWSRCSVVSFDSAKLVYSTHWVDFVIQLFEDNSIIELHGIAPISVVITDDLSLGRLVMCIKQRIPVYAFRSTLASYLKKKA